MVVFALLTTPSTAKMPRCTRKGCLKEYDEAQNGEGSCQYHPGGPVRFPACA